MSIMDRYHVIKKIGACLILLLLIIIVHSPFLWKSNLSGAGDTIFQDIPLHSLAGQMWKEGQIPIWNSYNFTGQPLAGIIYTGALYPPNILYSFFSPLIAHKIIMIGSLWWMGIGFLLWSYKRGFPPALIFACGLLGAIQPIYYFAHLQIRDTLIWLPWMLWACDNLLQSKGISLRWIIFNSLIWAFSFLAGFTQFWFYLMLVLIFYILFQKGWKIEWLFVCILTIILLIPQIILTLPLYKSSMRTNNSYCFQNYFPPSLMQILDTLLLFIVPYKKLTTQFNYIEPILIFYVSPILIASCLSIYFCRSENLRLYKLWLLCIIAISCVLAFTKLPCYCPLLSSFRLHQRFMAVLLPYVILISAIAVFNYWYTRQRGISPWLLTMLILIFIGCLSGHWHERLKSPLTIIIIAIDYVVVAAIIVLLFLKRFSKTRVQAGIGILLFAVAIQYIFSFALYLKNYFVYELYDQNKHKNQLVAHDAHEGVFASFISLYREMKSSGFDPYINLAFNSYQLDFLPGALTSNNDIRFRSLLYANPKVWPLFGVNYYLESLIDLNFYNQYRMDLLFKIIDFDHSKEFASYHQLKQACIKPHQEGWILTNDRSSSSYTLFRFNKNSIQQEYSFSSINEITLICPARVESPPFFIARKNNGTWDISKNPVKNEVLFNIAMPYLYEKIPVQAMFSDSENIIISYINNESKAELIKISSVKKQIIHMTTQGNGIVDLMPAILYTATNKPLFWFHTFGGKAWFYSEPNLIPNKEYNWKLRQSQNQYYSLMLARMLQIANDAKWSELKKYPPEQIVLFHYQGFVFPKAWTVRRTKFTDFDTFLTTLSVKPIEKWKDFGIVDSINRQYNFKQGPAPRIIFKEWKATTIKLTTAGNEFRVLVLKIAPYPCWKAEIDGKETQLFPVNYVMQGIIILPGQHTISVSCRFSTMLENLTR